MTEQQKPKGRDMQLKIVACRQIYSGVNKRADAYTIYEIDAERPNDGVKINQKLRAFAALPIGQVVDVTVVPFNSDRHGRSFTLYPKNSKGGVSTQDQVNELRGDVEELFSRLQKLTERVTELESGKPAAEPAPQEPAADLQQRAAASFGEDAPW